MLYKNVSDQGFQKYKFIIYFNVKDITSYRELLFDNNLVTINSFSIM